MAYTQARKSKTRGTRYIGYYYDADGSRKVAGTFASDDEALRVAQAQEDHVRQRRAGTSPAEGHDDDRGVRQGAIPATD